MAEAIGLAGSLVGIAGAGISIVSTLTQFGISIRGSNEKITSLASRVSLTASILSNVASTVKQHSSGFKDREFRQTWGDVLGSCKMSYERLDKALVKARRSKPNSDKISVWGKLVWALGGEAEMRDLEAALERCCQQVMMMQQAVQLSVLSLVAQRQLSVTEIEEQRELMGKLQWLLTSLASSGVLEIGKQNSATGNNTKAQVIVIDEPEQVPEWTPESIPEQEDGPIGTKAFGPLSSGEQPQLPPLFGILGVGLNSLGIGQQVTKPVRKRPVSHQQVIPTQVDPEDHFYEAYYIVPRSVPRNQERGALQITKSTSDDYMIILVDAKNDYESNSNLRRALRRAKRDSESPQESLDSFPRSVRESLNWLTNHRKENVKDAEWSIAAGLELKYIEEALFRKFTSKAGFLIILRASMKQKLGKESATVKHKRRIHADYQTNPGVSQSSLKDAASYPHSKSPPQETDPRHPHRVADTMVHRPPYKTPTCISDKDEDTTHIVSYSGMHAPQRLDRRRSYQNLRQGSRPYPDRKDNASEIPATNRPPISKPYYTYKTNQGENEVNRRRQRLSDSTLEAKNSPRSRSRDRPIPIGVPIQLSSDPVIIISPEKDVSNTKRDSSHRRYGDENIVQVEVANTSNRHQRFSRDASSWGSKAPIVDGKSPKITSYTVDTDSSLIAPSLRRQSRSRGSESVVSTPEVSQKRENRTERDNEADRVRAESEKRAEARAKRAAYEQEAMAKGESAKRKVQPSEFIHERRAREEIDERSATEHGIDYTKYGAAGLVSRGAEPVSRLGIGSNSDTESEVSNDFTLVEERSTAADELHLSQKEAEELMMNFLKSFTTVQ